MRARAPSVAWADTEAGASRTRSWAIPIGPRGTPCRVRAGRAPPSRAIGETAHLSTHTCWSYRATNRRCELSPGDRDVVDAQQNVVHLAEIESVGIACDLPWRVGLRDAENAGGEEERVVAIQATSSKL